MKPNEIRNMRWKQVAVLNGMFLSVMILYFVITKLFVVKLAHFFLVLSVVILIQGIFGLIKGDSTKSIIPIFEKVAIYEKQHMGSEWDKQRKVSYIWNLVLSVILFLQSLSHWGYPERVFQIEVKFMMMLTIVLLILINISLFIHIKKVDRATSVQDLKGYTWKSNVISIVIGVVFAFVLIIISIFYIMSTI